MLFNDTKTEAFFIFTNKSYTMHNFKKLTIWQEAMSLAIDLYNITKHFPDAERYSLTSQIRRSAVSVPSNIAEGSGRSSSKDFENFLNYSTGSSFELETQLIIALKLGFISDSEFSKSSERLQSIQKKIYSFKQSLRNQPNR